MQTKWLQRQHILGPPPSMLVTVPHASPSQDVTRAFSVPSRQAGDTGSPVTSLSIMVTMAILTLPLL